MPFRSEPKRCVHGQTSCQECAQDWADTETIFEQSGRQYRDERQKQIERRGK